MLTPHRSLLASVFLFACASEPYDGPYYLRTAEGYLRVEPEFRDDGSAIVHGDIIVGADELAEHLLTADELEHVSDLPDGELAPYAAVRAIGAFRWPDGVIPFALHPSLSLAQRTEVDAAITHWEQRTAYTFVARNGETDFVTFTPGNNDGTCASQVGRVGGEQTIEVDSCPWGRIVHEIGHTVGFFHEHTRLDRDSYITINWENILAGCESQFETYAKRGRDGLDLGPYDYGSIMHYSGTQCDNGNGPSITPKQPGVVIGQREGLSLWDRYAAEKLLLGVDMTGPTGPAVTLYRNANYQGTRQTFRPGRYAAASLNMLDVIGDNQATSISVPPGLSVSLCTRNGEPLAGTCQTFTGNVPQLPSTIDNQTSLVDVDRAVTVYREAGLWGVSQTFAVGTYAANAGRLAVIGNDQISSLIVPPGLVAELCFSESGTGSSGIYCQTFEGNVNYVGDFMNDETSLIRVKRAVTLFQEAQLWGNRKSLTTGTWTSFGPVNGVSSLVVGNGLQAVVCDGAGGGAPCAVFRGDTSYVGPDLNDKVSYVRVELNAP